MARQPTIFTARDFTDPEVAAGKLNRMWREFLADPQLDRLRVGDEGIWLNDNSMAVGAVDAEAVDTEALTMATGAVVDYALVCNAAGVASWGSVTTSPPGSDTYLAFNDGGAWGSDSDLSYSTASDTLFVKNLSCSGELEGSRWPLVAGRAGASYTADTYLTAGMVLCSADQGFPMERAGKIVSIRCRLLVNSHSSGILDAEVRINGVANSDYVRKTLSGTGWTDWGKTIARDSAMSFAAGDYISPYIDLAGGSCDFGYPVMIIGVQLDT